MTRDQLEASFNINKFFATGSTALLAILSPMAIPVLVDPSTTDNQVRIATAMLVLPAMGLISSALNAINRGQRLGGLNASNRHAEPERPATESTVRPQSQHNG